MNMMGKVISYLWVSISSFASSNYLNRLFFPTVCFCQKLACLSYAYLFQGSTFSSICLLLCFNAGAKLSLLLSLCRIIWGKILYYFQLCSFSLAFIWLFVNFLTLYEHLACIFPSSVKYAIRTLMDNAWTCKVALEVHPFVW